MATRYIDKVPAATTGNCGNFPDSAGLVYDSADGLLKYNDAGTITPLATAASGSSRVVGGTGTLDGTNPTSIDTGLTTVTAFVVTLIDSAGVDAGTAFLTHDTPVAGVVDVYAWVVAGTASTGTETFSWIAVGE